MKANRGDLFIDNQYDTHFYIHLCSEGSDEWVKGPQIGINRSDYSLENVTVTGIVKIRDVVRLGSIADLPRLPELVQEFTRG